MKDWWKLSDDIHVTGAASISVTGFFLATPKSKIELMVGKYNNKSRKVAITGSELWKQR